MSNAVHRIGDWHHPMYGTCSTLFMIGHAERYCRQILDSPQNRNILQQAELEAQLTTWKTSPPNPGLAHLYEAFRNHRLIFLYRARAHAQSSYLADPDSFEAQELLISQQYAEKTVRHLMQIPATSNYLNFQSLPLITAGSELTESNHFLRDQVHHRLRAIFSLNRFPANLLALQCLEEIWDARDSGNQSFWLLHMLQTGRRLLLG
ncbi:hypothetical protein N7481_012576 [Penicillium waksmanii]|uniref:uncharacterized protein n=1 Tax=Penicillium waksmanii TaxID=69791 RepID=UPI0025490B57|nr:uncharacterized protein N7481_012576 [Penicillium waksmanii]KAJ5965862.1 hypothetical protein N7481_012576 [Penicillium waksmanii]